MLYIMEQEINGFERHELFVLYIFLNAYENKRLKYLKEGELLLKYPSMKDVHTIISSICTDEKTKAELKQVDINTLNNEFYFTSHCSKMLGVLYHLRNSIAHANIRKVNDDVYIEDFNTSKTNPEHTAKGKLSFKTIEEIVEITKKIMKGDLS